MSVSYAEYQEQQEAARIQEKRRAALKRRKQLRAHIPLDEATCRWCKATYDPRKMRSGYCSYECQLEKRHSRG